MRSPRPLRSLRLLRPVFQLQYTTRFSTMPGNNTPKEKKPPLTHFLCVPLVNSSSLPQLESSLSAFKAAIPPSPDQHANPRAPTQPLIPDGAIRPIGTLHLTLGVMSLPTRERLDEALEFFQSLNLTSMAREAEVLALSRSSKRGELAGSTPTSTATAPSPFRISLESLHALPRARSATVLHAAPVDSSSRLYPFCEMVRDKFLEAGFLLGETKGNNKNQNQNQNNSQTQPEDTKQPNDNEQSTLSQLPTEIATEPTESKPVKPPKPPKPKPLLLHATVVNTIYVKGRRGGSSNRGSGNRNHRTTRYAFDARDMLAQYRDYYLDSLRTQPRGAQVGLLASTAQTETLEGEGEGEPGNGSSDVENEVDDTVDKPRQETKYPFLWAKDFPLESICICEMGAKKLDPENDSTGLNGRLREKYTVVSERSLDFVTQHGENTQ